MMIAVTSAMLFKEGRLVILQWSEPPVSGIHVVADVQSAEPLFITEPSVYTCTTQFVWGPLGRFQAVVHRRGRGLCQPSCWLAAPYHGASMASARQMNTI